VKFVVQIRGLDMAVFSRRTLQRLIDENATFLTHKQSKDHVNRLNRLDESAIDAEWEIVVLNALSKVGQVAHERLFRNRRPDIYFKTKSAYSESFIGDIATISDKGLDEKFPVFSLHDELMRRVKEHGLDPNKFYLRIDRSERSLAWDPSKPVMTLARSRFSQIFNADFVSFLATSKANPMKPHEYRTKDSDTPILIRFDPRYDSPGMCWPGYHLVKSLVQNTVYHRLEEKAGKLSDAEFDGRRAVVLCDAGCTFLTSWRDLATYHVSDVIFYFLDQHPEITFVLTVHVDQQFGYKSTSDVVINLYRRKNSDEEVGREILACLYKLENAFPEPERSGLNGLNLLRGRRPEVGASFIGGWSVGDTDIKISARSVLELLAGEITQERFLELHSFNSSMNPFRSMLRDYKLISAVSLERGTNEQDDDWIKFEFDSTDAAISPFRLPK
jgi:hypothetical protein